MANTMLMGDDVTVSRGKNVAQGPRLRIDLTTGKYRFEVEGGPAPPQPPAPQIPVGRRNWIGLSCGPLINMMKTSEHGYCDDPSSLGASMRRKWLRLAGRTLSNRTVWAPAVEVADILGQDFLQMALIEDEHVVQALGPDRSHPAL